MQKGFVRHFKQPLWLGKELLKDKIILIHAEQGLGDSIQFCRYISMIEGFEPKKIILEAPKALVSLLSTLKNNFTIIEQGNTIPDFDLHCPIMSLPNAFKTSVATIPADVPYLFAEEIKNKQWKNKLGLKTKPRVGIVWSGSLDHKADHYPASRRNISLRKLSSLFKLPLEFHLLQKEVRNEDNLALNSLAQINCHQDELIDFSDTAALVMQMDLVISICTSVAHLAGSLGVKTWVLLPYSADFRWMLDRSDSPWYPTATLFRQPEIGDWESVIDQVVIALLEFQSDSILI
jgi:ADP-heptose:LPS heptosyltransferase